MNPPWGGNLSPACRGLSNSDSASGPLVAVNWKPRDQSLDLLAHTRFHQYVFVRALLREHVENFHDHLADLAELRDPETPRGAGRRPQPHTRRDGRLLGIEWDAV